MGETEVIELSPSPVKMEEDGTPLRPIFCLKNRTDIKLVEEIHDCFILDFDPSDSITIANLSLSDFDDAEADNVALVWEKGQVACRDYPHSRHLCLKFPFETTPHESYCDLCYCYVCDKAAPCKDWTGSARPHCDASDNVEHWASERHSRKLIDKK